MGAQDQIKDLKRGFHS